MTCTELIKSLQRLKVETESIACLGCGHEHNCGIRGCAIIREAVERISSIQSAFSDGPYGFSHLLELLRAEKDGRVVVLPNKPSSTITNADRIRNATNQQLAKQIYDDQKELCRMVYKNLGFEDELNFSEDYSDILAWLNAPAKTGEAKVDVDNG